MTSLGCDSSWDGSYMSLLDDMAHVRDHAQQIISTLSVQTDQHSCFSKTSKPGRIDFADDFFTPAFVAGGEVCFFFSTFLFLRGKFVILLRVFFLKSWRKLSVLRLREVCHSSVRHPSSGSNRLRPSGAHGGCHILLVSLARPSWAPSWNPSS